MLDPLGDRLKGEFESQTRLLLPRKTHTIIRLDGKAFHSYTRGLARPFDAQLHEDLVGAATFLCENVTGTLLAYVQSDEVSLLVTDLAKPGTQPWYGGNVQKIASVTASLFTAKFNALRAIRAQWKLTEDNAVLNGHLGIFDSRVFTIPTADDVVDYFHWRYLDAWRNAISSLASTYFSPRELHEKSVSARLIMLMQAGVNVSDVDPRFKYGSIVEPVTHESSVKYLDKRSGELRWVEGVQRRSWETRPAPSLDDVNDLLSLNSKVNGFLAFGEFVYSRLDTLHTPQEPGDTVDLGAQAPDATPGVATRPASS